MCDVIKTIRAYLQEHESIPTSFGQLDVEKISLGQGGNGLVFPIEFEGPAVIKFFTEPVSDTPSTKYKRFQREYRRLVRIPNHPHLVRLFHYELIMIDGIRIPAIIMERCAKSLKAHVLSLEDKRLSLAELETLCQQLCNAVDHIHKNGVIHRDIKPENILVRDNGAFVLADFGIAKFDPELFPGTDLTKRGDRMANFAFSAPEQFEKDAVITPAADIFALGQVLYWCVTNKTFRGASPPRMEQIDKSYSQYDEVVRSMSKQDPVARLQSGQTVLETVCKVESHRKTQEGHAHVIKCLEDFEHTLRKCTPGQRGIIHLADKDDINTLLESLSDICESHELWGTQGYANDAIRYMEKLDDESWLVGQTEYDITDCWVTRDSSLDRCSVLLRSDAMPPFGIYGQHGGEDEIAGFFEGNYIDYKQHDDGFARINGKTVGLNGRSKVRHRFLRPNYFFVATKYNSVLVREADKVINPIIKSYNSGHTVQEEQLMQLLKLPKNKVSQMFD